MMHFYSDLYSMCSSFASSSIHIKGWLIHSFLCLQWTRIHTSKAWTKFKLRHLEKAHDEHEDGIENCKHQKGGINWSKYHHTSGTPLYTKLLRTWRKVGKRKRDQLKSSKDKYFKVCGPMNRRVRVEESMDQTSKDAHFVSAQNRWKREKERAQMYLSHCIFPSCDTNMKCIECMNQAMVKDEAIENMIHLDASTPEP